MKKILLSFILLLSATIGMAQDQDWEEVSNLEELKKAINKHTYDYGKKSNAKIKLTDDICLDGLQDLLVVYFTGIIDGDYLTQDPYTGKDIHASHIIYGGKDNNGNMTRKTCSKLFNTLEDAEIKNVIFNKIRVEDEEYGEFGMIARRANHSKFENIIANEISVFDDKSYVGTLVGDVEDCDFKCVMIASCDVTTDDERAGGIVGWSKNSKYYLCITSASSSVFADGDDIDNMAICGGIVGTSEHDNFNYCYNFAMVAADQEEVGGITGMSEYSNFYHCINNGSVFHCDSDDFEKACNDQRKECAKISLENVHEFCQRLFDEGTTITDPDIDVNRAAAMSYVIAAADLSDNAFRIANKFVNDQCYKCIQRTLTMQSGGAGEGIAVIIMAVGAYVSAASYSGLAGDDEVGGISGEAKGGIFEYCTNTGLLGCRDDDLGGIVGLGYGVTINNCLNTGQLAINEKDTSGSIIGQADKNGDTACKITNCCSATAVPIIGTYHNALDHASGNNYYVKGSGTASTDWDEEVDELLMTNGTVAYWLNNGIENREKGIKPWHQNLWTSHYHGTRVNPDLYPSLDVSHDEVNIDLLYDNYANDEHTYLISTPERLLEFASAVNNGNQFARGFLTKDINMEGIEWTPIGKDAPNCHFRGVFDGKGHTISGLTYTSTNNEPAGLFGAVHAGADIRNVIIGKGSKFCGPNQYDKEDAGAGGIVGQVKMGPAWKWGNVFIENCGSYADIEVGRHGGGILGNVDVDGERVRVYVNNCFSMGAVKATNSNSALLCGYMKNHGVVRNCWSGGKLEGTLDGSLCPYDKINQDGGKAECLVGYNSGLDINNCYIVDPDKNVDLWFQESVTLQKGVAIINAEDLPNGKFAYKLNGITNDATKSLLWQQNIGKDANPVPGNKGIYHSRNINKEYGTICLPFTLYSNDDIKYYKFSNVTTDEGETKLKFTYTDKVIPGTPTLFYAKATGDHTFIDYVDKYDRNYDEYNFGLSMEVGNGDWKMHSHPFEKVFEGDEAKTVYYVSDKEIRNAKKTTVAPYRAYFRGPSIEKLQSGGYAKVIIVFEDENGEETSIELVGDDFIPVLNNGKTYSLMGTEVGEDYRGIVINNGKKVLRK